VKKLLALLRTPAVLHAVGVFAAALVAQPAVAALLGGSVKLSTAGVVSALVAASAVVLRTLLAPTTPAAPVSAPTKE